MKRRVTVVFLALFASISSFCQTYIQYGDRCFDSGDYVCAVTNYNNAFVNATGRDKQIAEIKLTRAKWCTEHLNTANTAFAAKNYMVAKEEFQKVLDSNPKDIYAKEMIERCNTALTPVTLRKATAADIADIWNDKYGINPERRQNLINAGIDPDDAQRRINEGEGKPQIKDKKATYLTVSKNTLYFSSAGGTSEQIKIYTDANSYSVPLSYMTTWCTVKTYNGYFTITADANPNYTSRKDWFKVTAGGKEVKISVEQSAKSSSNSYQANKKKTQSSSQKSNNRHKQTNVYFGVSVLKPLVLNNNNEIFANNKLGYSFTVGIVKTLGIYAKYSTTFNSPKAQYSTDNFPKNYYAKPNYNSSFERESFIGGLMIKTKPIIFYLGAGSGHYNHLSEVKVYNYLNDNYLNTSFIKSMSFEGLEADAGMIININNVGLTFGVTSISLKYTEFNIGLGVRF